MPAAVSMYAWLFCALLQAGIFPAFIKQGYSCRENGDHHEDTNGNDKTTTYRLNEGINSVSRAEDLDDLKRLQKSSTKPRPGKWTQAALVWITLEVPHVHALLNVKKIFADDALQTASLSETLKSTART